MAGWGSVPLFPDLVCACVLCVCFVCGVTGFVGNISLCNT